MLESQAVAGGLVAVALILLQVVLLYLAADFAGGLFHWAEDTIGDEHTPVWGRYIVGPNIGHHDDPADIVRWHWLISNRIIFIGTALISLLVWITGNFSWQFAVFAVFAGLNQQVHRLSHMPTRRLGPTVRMLQRTGLIQDARQHWAHHRAPHTSAYCVLTPWLNPLLDRSGFWRVMDHLAAAVFPTPRRPELHSGI